MVRRNNTTRRAVVLAVVVLAVAAVAPVEATAALASASDGGADLHTEDNTLPSLEAFDSSENIVDQQGAGVTADTSANIDDEIEDADGTIEVVVRFEEANPFAVATSDEPADVLQTHAEDTQQGVLEYAENTDGVEVVNQFWLTNAALVTLDAGHVDVEELAAQPGVTELHENFEVEVPEPESFDPSDTDEDMNTTYGLDQINTTQVWDEFDTQGEGAKIAVLDTGVDVDHPDLDLFTENPEDETYPGGWAEIDGSGNTVPGSTPYDTGFHGTHVSGTVAGGNSSGTAIGVAPEANLMHGLVLPGGQGGFVQIIGGMEWAVEENADVISMSLGADGTHPELIEPVRNAEEAGTMVVGAAGNSGPGVTGTPGNVFDTLAVGASDESENIAGFSGGQVIDTEEDWGGEAPDDWPAEYIVPNVAGPGVDVLSAIPEDYDDPEAIYGSASGTSMATPHVSGAIALMLSASGGQLSSDEISDALEAHAWKPDGEEEGQDTRYGHGIIDALAATETSAVDSGVVGTVEDVDGEPIADASVSFDGFPTRTDSDGSYDINLAPGTYTVEADAFAHQPVEETVTVEEDEFTEQNFTLEPSVEVVLLEGQPLGVQDGGSFDVEVSVENLEEYEVTATGDYPLEELTLLLDGDEIEPGEPVSFDEPVSDEITLTVETAENTSGDISLTHEFSGFGVTDTVETGPTGVFDETVDVGVVDDASSTYGDSMQTFLQQTAPWFDVDAIDGADLESTVTDDEYDVYIVQNFGDADVEWFLDETEEPDVGVVLLDQFGEESDGITQYGSERGNPNAVVNATGTIQQPTVGYQIEQDHPFFENVGEEGDMIPFYTSPAVLFEAGYHATMEGFSSGDYGNVVTADTAITGTFGTTATGTGLAEDQFTRTVWAPSLGYSSFAGVGDSFSTEAYEILANVVEYANEEPVIEPTSPQEDRIDPGTETTVEVETPDLEEVTVDLAEESTLEAENLSLSINGEEVSFGETLETTADSLSITAETDADSVGIVSLDHTVVTTPDDESVETTFTTGPTSVYEAPLEVPQDTDSVQHALDLAIDDEEIIVGDGTYEEDAPDAPIMFGPALWIENDGITLTAAEDADPTILYSGDDQFVQNGIYVTGNDVHVDGLTVNLEDGEAVEGGMPAFVTDVYEGTPTENLTVTDITHGGHRGVMIQDGVSNVTIDGYTGIDASGIAGSYNVVVQDGDAETTEVEDSTVFDPELHGLDHLAAVDFEQLADYGLEFSDRDVETLEEVDAEDLAVEALVDHDLERLDASDIAEIEGTDVDPHDDILPRPDPIPVTENIHITDSELAEASSTNAHGLVLRDVQNVTVEDTEVADDDLRRALFFQTSQQQESTSVEPVTEDVEISNVTAAARTNSDSVIRFRSASGTVEDTTIEDGAIGVRQDESLAVPLSLIEPEIEVSSSSVTVEEEGIFAKHATELTAELNEFDAATGVHLDGEIDPHDVTVWYNNLAATDVAVALDGETVGTEPVNAGLNYLGEDPAPAVGDVTLSPFLSEPPGDEIPDFGDVESPVINLDLEENGTYAVGVPGPTDATLDDVFQNDVEGVVYGFNAHEQSWTQLTADDSLSALQALMIVAGEDTVAQLSFESGDGPPGPGQTELVEGWNFVAAPFYGTATETFVEYATSDVPLITHTVDRPGGQLGTPGDLDGTWTGSEDAHVSPFEGYFVFSDGEGILPAHLSADPDLHQLYEQLQIGDETEPEGELELDDLEPESVTVEQGEPFDALLLATNTGDELITDTLELSADGELLAFDPVAVDGGETKVVSFDDVDTSDLEPGEYTFGVFGSDDEVTGDLTVEEPPEPAEFVVDDLEPESVTVEPDAEIDVSATVENVGEEAGEQTIELQIDSNTVEDEPVDLEPEESRQVTFEGVSTAGFDAGTYVHAVVSEDDSAAGTLTIEDPDESEFVVEDLDPETATVEQGEELDVSATVENVGEEAGDQTVELLADDEVLGTEPVDLGPEESTTVTFENVTVDLEPGEYTHGVFTDDDEATGSLTVESVPDPATFEVSDLEPETATVQTGETVDVSATVENVGEEAGDQTVELQADDEVLETEPVDLEPEESTTVTFEDVTVDLEPGEYTHGVFSDDDEATGSLTVLTDEDVVLTVDPDPAGFDSVHTWEVTNVDLGGETLDGLIVDYSGTGTEIDIAVQDAEVDVTTPDGEEVTVDLGTDDSDSDEILDMGLGPFEDGAVPDGPATFVADDVVNPGEAGEYDANITFLGDEGGEETFETTFEVTPVDPAEFEVASLTAPEAVTEAEAFDVESTIENVGDLEDTQTVEYRIVEAGEPIEDADPTFEQNVTLDLGESESVDFTDVIAADEDLEPGDYEHGIFTDNDSATADFEIQPFDTFSVSSLDFEAPAETVANQPFDVTTNVTNFADEERTETVELRFGDEADDLETIASEDLTLAAGEETELSFTNVVVDEDGFGEGEYVHGIFADESEYTADIEVFPAVDVDLEVDPNASGETATHSWEIESADFGGESLDYIGVQYNGTGASFDSLSADDASVELTASGEDEPEEVDLSDGSSVFEEEYAELSFGLFADSSSDGQANVVMEGVENPTEPGEYEVTLEFVEDPGLDDEFLVLTYTATFEVSEDGETSASVTGVDTQTAGIAAAGA